jgi:hypothetical protein
VAKFTKEQRLEVKSIVANLSIKRIPDQEIIKEIYGKMNKTITRMELWNIRQRIKKESYHWYKTMREGQYEYIHEFKERISEIIDLQKRHQAILDSDEEPTTVKQTSLAELHRLNITLSNYFDVAPSILSNATIPTTQQAKAATTETKGNFIV